MRGRVAMGLAMALLVAAAFRASAQTGAASGGAGVVIEWRIDARDAGIEGNSHLTDLEKKVAEKAYFTLTARDNNGNVIRGWNRMGLTIALLVKNSTANSDTSARSWNADPLAYSWYTVACDTLSLIAPPDTVFLLPATAFDDNGRARIYLIDTKAERGIFIEAGLAGAIPNAVTENVNFRALGATNFLVEVTSSTPVKNQVFLMKPYEMIVTPRDKFLNPSSDTVKSRFTARWPGEFDESGAGHSGLFTGDVFLSGPTAYYLASGFSRVLPQDQLQWIMVYSATNDSVCGRTTPYEILPHAPAAFKLLWPPDHWICRNRQWYRMKIIFTWERPDPPDPYYRIRKSRSDTTLCSDVVRYKWIVLDSISLTRAQVFDSDSMGLKPCSTQSIESLYGILEKMLGRKPIWDANFVWYVTASDDLTETKSSPPSDDISKRPGYRMSWEFNPGDPVENNALAMQLSLDQNYPNPTATFTAIRFGIPGHGRTVLTLYDRLGALVATLIDAELDPGEYSLPFKTSGLSSGVYTYRLLYGGRTITKRMTVMK
jgi:hypothetical protein